MQLTTEQLGLRHDRTEANRGDWTMRVNSVSQMKKQFPWSITFWSLAILTLVGCAAPGVLFGETVGEHFRRAMAEKEAFCKAHPPARGDTQCDWLNLKPRDWNQSTFVPVEGQPEPVPQEWVATPEGKFAHSIEIPNPLPKDSGYRPGMTSEEYFKHLCATEAGEFIYKTVENVDGILQMRPREKATDYMLEHLYAIEDPYDYLMDGDATEPEFTFVRKDRYHFFENKRVRTATDSSLSKFRDSSYFISVPPDSNVQRFFGYNGSMRSMRKEFDANVKARYGYTWRGIRRSNDLELGIAGGELIIIDLQNDQVLGVRRNFARSGNIRNNLTGIWWMTAQSCPQIVQKGKVPSRIYKQENVTFISKVLRPSKLMQ